MEWVWVIVIVIIALIILVTINAIFIYLPVNRIETKVDTLIGQVEKALPSIEQTVTDVRTAAEGAIRTEATINNLAETASCAICKAFPSPELCENGRLKPVSEICPMT